MGLIAARVRLLVDGPAPDFIQMEYESPRRILQYPSGCFSSSLDFDPAGIAEYPVPVRFEEVDR